MPKEKIKPAKYPGAMTVRMLHSESGRQRPFDEGGIFKVTVMDDNGVEKLITGRIQIYKDRLVLRTNGEFQTS
jgi:hypothetical protein